MYPASLRAQEKWNLEQPNVCCHGSNLLLFLIYPDTPGKVPELMKFGKLPDTILIALFEAKYSILSHFEQLVLEAIGSTAVQGKGTELYELLARFDFAFLYHHFSKPKHCSMNNCSSFYELLNTHTIPISFLSLQYCQDFCLSCNSLIHLHKPLPLH